MERRLTRARNKVSDARIPFRVPTDDLLVERLAGVLRVVYLVFNEGHALRPELRAEAIRLARLLVRLMPDEAEVHGLLALFLLTDARSRGAGRRRRAGVAAPSRTAALWDRAAIAEGVRVLERALRLPRPGSYAIQAAIAAVHDEAPDFAATDWAQIAGLYEQLLRHDPSPVVALNRAVAVGFAEGAEAGLALLPDDPRLARYAPLHAARFELLRRSGRRGRGRRRARRRDRALRQRGRARRAPQPKGTVPLGFRRVPDRRSSAPRRQRQPGQRARQRERRRRASRARSRRRTTRSRPRRRRPRP